MERASEELWVGSEREAKPVKSEREAHIPEACSLEAGDPCSSHPEAPRRGNVAPTLLRGALALGSAGRECPGR